MKILISIISCLEYVRNGVNQSLRDTWLKDIARFPDVTYKIFLGDGTPVEDSEIFENSWASRGSRYTDKPTHVGYETYYPEMDEIILPVPDDYKHISFKTRESHRWAVNNGFDFLFQGYADVYVDVDRLLSSGFQNYKYCGGENGGGYWLDKESLKWTSSSPVTAWNDDGWVREVLKGRGIELNIDGRYAAFPNTPQTDNIFITSHLTISPEIHVPEKMYEACLRRIK